MFEIMLPKSLLEDYVDIEAAGSCWSPNIHLLGGGGTVPSLNHNPLPGRVPSTPHGKMERVLKPWGAGTMRYSDLFRSSCLKREIVCCFMCLNNNLPLSSWRCPAHFWASEFSSWNGRVKVFLNRDLCGRVNKMMLKRCRDKSFTES